MSDKPFSVAVYCASSNKVEQTYFDDAVALGEGIAKRGWRLVYGAGSTGLMGAVARTAQAHGGKVYGVIPHFLDTLEVTYLDADELVRVETMRERKALMEINSDGFIALPGGFGTLEEFFEVLTWLQLGLHGHPVGILNVNGYYDFLLKQLDVMVEQQFLKPANRALVITSADPIELVSLMSNFKADLSDKWFHDRNLT